MGRVKGKIVIVTGAARGQGESHTRRLAAEGAAILMGDVLDDLGEKVAAELREAGHDVHYFHLDVTSEADWEAIVAEAEKRWGKLDILLNNAGVVGSMQGSEKEDLDSWSRLISINQTGVFLGLKHGAPAIRRAGGGSIVNTCSINGTVGADGFFSYIASKGAVKMMTKSAALEYAKGQVRVNSISPALVMTKMAEEEGEESNRAFINATPLGRAAVPEDITNAVLFLASDESSYITGADLVIDGGYTAQ